MIFLNNKQEKRLKNYFFEKLPQEQGGGVTAPLAHQERFLRKRIAIVASAITNCDKGDHCVVTSYGKRSSNR